ncbi:MAG TPA: hypothetical protein VJZ69_02945 [Clostridia bacterium]|nr:hypothetical protein [Clostridia bacterium]
MEVEDKRKESTFSKFKNNGILKKLKKVKNIEFIACVFILAIALLLYSVINKAQAGSIKTVEVDAETEVSTEIETRLEQILSQIEGAGDVSVMITYSSEVQGGNEGEISGVVVVASGADDIGVRLDLLQAVETALNVDVKFVNVFIKK